MINSRSDLSLTIFMYFFTIVFAACGVANIWICYVAKGSTLDIYPVAETIWIICNIWVVFKCKTMKQLVIAIIGFQFFDSFVDLCALGNKNTWWAGPPLLVEWQWNRLHADQIFYKYFYSYWIFTWVLQVPLRCIALARMVSGNWGKQFLVIAVGLNVIWFTAPQDVLYYFVWWGMYDLHHPYFRILPPEGFWNLWNMLFLRVPLGVTMGALLVHAGRSAGIWSRLTLYLFWSAIIVLGLYATYFMVILRRTFT